MIEWLQELYRDPTCARLLSAALLGSIVGAERQWRKEIGGLRTNILVSLGAAAFVDLMAAVGQGQGLPQGIGSIVSGIGFLGAGLIIKEGASIRGLNSAATVWCSAAMGAAAGASEATAAILLCIFVTSVNVVLRPIVSMLARRPAPKPEEPTVYSVYVSSAATDVARASVIRLAKTTGLALRAIRTGEPDERGVVEVAAELVSTGDASDELATLADHLAREPQVRASWCQRGGFGGAGRSALQGGGLPARDD